MASRISETVIDVGVSKQRLFYLIEKESQHEKIAIFIYFVVYIFYLLRFCNLGGGVPGRVDVTKICIKTRILD
jgi:hypothetical protein